MDAQRPARRLQHVDDGRGARQGRGIRRVKRPGVRIRVYRGHQNGGRPAAALGSTGHRSGDPLDALCLCACRRRRGQGLLLVGRLGVRPRVDTAQDLLAAERREQQDARYGEQRLRRRVRQKRAAPCAPDGSPSARPSRGPARPPPPAAGRAESAAACSRPPPPPGREARGRRARSTTTAPCPGSASPPSRARSATTGSWSPSSPARTPRQGRRLLPVPCTSGTRR